MKAVSRLKKHIAESNTLTPTVLDVLGRLGLVLLFAFSPIGCIYAFMYPLRLEGERSDQKQRTKAQLLCLFVELRQNEQLDDRVRGFDEQQVHQLTQLPHSLSSRLEAKCGLQDDWGQNIVFNVQGEMLTLVSYGIDQKPETSDDLLINNWGHNFML